jgi:tetratricopeptide (TPR) repeat protein
VGYAAQLRHYVSGRAADRDEALASYATALSVQDMYARAAYNRATLLYNLYVPGANEEAIRLFGQATSCSDSRVRALASAGLTMAYAQAIQRFGRTDPDLISKAVDAGQDALSLDPLLEESRFAVGWGYQLRKDWRRAVSEYESVAELRSTAAPGRRITSFALNNAGWIWLTPLRNRVGALGKAEAYLWAALRYYPNKIAYVNLAEVARRTNARDVAIKLFDAALNLDPAYVNAWNERAIVEVEMADEAASRRKRTLEERYRGDARIHHQRALHLAGDAGYRQKLVDAYRGAVDAHAPSKAS